MKEWSISESAGKALPLSDFVEKGRYLVILQGIDGKLLGLQEAMVTS